MMNGNVGKALTEAAKQVPALVVLVVFVGFVMWLSHGKDEHYRDSLLAVQEQNAVLVREQTAATNGLASAVQNLANVGSAQVREIDALAHRIERLETAVSQ